MSGHLQIRYTRSVLPHSNNPPTRTAQLHTASVDSRKDIYPLRRHLLQPRVLVPVRDPIGSYSKISTVLYEGRSFCTPRSHTRPRGLEGGRVKSGCWSSFAPPTTEPGMGNKHGSVNGTISPMNNEREPAPRVQCSAVPNALGPDSVGHEPNAREGSVGRSFVAHCSPVHRSSAVVPPCTQLARALGDGYMGEFTCRLAYGLPWGKSLLWASPPKS
jgi:hypothetical protein